MKSTIFAVMSAAAITVASSASATTVDFGGFAEGDELGLNTDLGGGIIADISAVGGIDKAVVFDTTPGTTSTTNDPDLQSDFTNAQDDSQSRSFGKALIIQENETGGPDDDARGGTLTFSFQELISLSSVSLLDTAVGTTATLFLDGSEVLSFILDSNNESDTGNSPDNNEFTFLDFGGAKGNKLAIGFADSGAIGEFDASVVPVPAGLPLLLGSLGAFAYLNRRKKT